MIKASRPK